jgi:hypothetical protein
MRALPCLLLASALLAGCAALGDLIPPSAQPFRGCSVQTYTIGRAVTGTLSEQSCALQGGRRVNYYELNVTSRQRVAVRVGSGEFDTYLYLFTRDDRQIAANDDITPILNTDSRVVETLEPGRYIIGVSAASAAGMGTYSLTSELR